MDTSSIPIGIGIIYSDAFPDEPFADAVNEPATENFRVVSEKRPNGIIYASIEWLTPTAIAFFISGAYFQGFIGAAAQDHYLKLKSVCSRVFQRFAKTHTTTIATAGKVSSDNPFSSVISIEAAATSGIVFKLLFQKSMSADETDEATRKFLDFVERFHRQHLPAETIEKIETYRVMGSRILICLDQDVGALRLVSILENKEPAALKTHLAIESSST